jgi:hypothetical protein
MAAPNLKKVKLTKVEQLLLMSAAVNRRGPYADLTRASTLRVIRPVLEWTGWIERDLKVTTSFEDCPGLMQCYRALIRMLSIQGKHGTWSKPKRPGKPLFQGNGMFGLNGCILQDPTFTSCRLTAEGKRLALQLLKRHPEFRR